jgi:hypothetical protein
MTFLPAGCPYFEVVDFMVIPDHWSWMQFVELPEGFHYETVRIDNTKTTYQYMQGRSTPVDPLLLLTCCYKW